MTTFVLGSAAGGEIGFIRILIAALVTAGLFMVKAAKAAFDSLFEAIGLLLGRPLFRAPRAFRLLVVLCGAISVFYLLLRQPWWFVVACLALMALDLFASFGRSLNREPRLLLIPFKGFAIVSSTLWGWGSGWMLAIVTYLVVSRAFQFLLEGMTIAMAEKQQSDRDRRIADLFEQLKSGDELKPPRERIILYLRPFSITNRIKADEGKFLEAVDRAAIREEEDQETKQWARTTIPLLRVELGVKEGASLFEQNSEMETIIEHALRGAGHFVALGRPGEALGAGRLPTAEAEWQDSVRLLINAATLCIVIPSAASGTQWEIRHIVQTGQLEKCCILMPPGVGKSSYAEEWSGARAALSDILPLPEYQPTGWMFRCHADTGAGLPPPPTIAGVPSSPPEAFAMMIQALFPELPQWKVETEANPNWLHAGIHNEVSVSFGRSGG